MAVSAGDPGVSADADGVAEAQSGAAPTAEGKSNTSSFLSWKKSSKVIYQHLLQLTNDHVDIILFT